MKYGPEDFRGESPPPRIIGTETEYHTQINLINKPIRALRNKDINIKYVGEFCSLGARVYRDLGKLEYATPECAGPDEAAAADFLGMAIVQEMTKIPENSKQLPTLRVAGTYSVKTCDTNTLGYHQNFLVAKPETIEEALILKAVIGSFLATRIVWDGAGLATPKGYLLSQKSTGIGDGVRNDYGQRTTHRSKPMAVFMDSESADDKIGEGWALLEVRSGDAHMSRAQAATSLAAVSLVLRLLERGIINLRNAGDFILKNPVAAMQQTNQQMGFAEVELASGKTTTALGLQKRFANAIKQMCEDNSLNLPADERKAAAKLIEICDLLDTATELKPLVPDVEWAAKKYYSDKITTTIENELDFGLRWHRTDAKSIGLKIYDKLYEKFDIGEPSTVQQKDFSPSTRAAARGKMIAAGVLENANWRFVKLKTGEKIDLADYWQTEPPEEVELAA